MSKGLQLTLVTVAIALLGMSAMAEAPVIGDIPSPIVGGGPQASPSNHFVYPDAINLNSWITDDGPSENIVVSYWVDGTAIYNINGTEPLDLGSDDPNDPAATDKDLETVRNGEDNPDNLAQTITVRNVNLSPLSQDDNNDPGATEGILSSETQTVTLFASDGTTYSMKDILVYTDNGGPDALSPEGGETKWSVDFTGDDHDWATAEAGATVSVGQNGICIEVPAANTNVGSWTGPYAPFQMEGNSVYHVRATMNGTQGTAGFVPLWDIIVQNFEGVTGLQGANAYLADYYYLDNEGGAYAVGPSTGITSVDFYFVPLPANLASWNDASTGAWTTTNDAKNDIQVIFRMLDADATGGYGGELDFGQVCVKTLTFDRFNLTTDVSEGATVWNGAINEDNYRSGTLTSQTAFDFSTAGQVTITPTGSTNPTDIGQLLPGDGVGVYDTGEASDDFPVTWEADTLYMIEVGVSAVDAAAEDQPVDVIQVGMDPPTWENFSLNTVTRGDSTMHNIGMPKSAATEQYVSFYKSDKVSMTGTAKWKALRPRVLVLDSSGLSFNSQATNTGGFIVHNITVKKVTIP